MYISAGSMTASPLPPVPVFLVRTAPADVSLSTVGPSVRMCMTIGLSMPIGEIGGPGR
jgi:hypothetical protein